MNKRHARKARLMAHEFKSVLDSLGFSEVGVVCGVGKDEYRIAGRNFRDGERTFVASKAIDEALVDITKRYNMATAQSPYCFLESDGNDGHTSDDFCRLIAVTTGNLYNVSGFAVH